MPPLSKVPALLPAIAAILCMVVVTMLVVIGPADPVASPILVSTEPVAASISKSRCDMVRTPRLRGCPAERDVRLKLGCH